MSPVPVNPNPDFIAGTAINPDAVDANFRELYKALDPGQVGLDDANIAPGANIAASKLKATSFSAVRGSIGTVSPGVVVVYDTEEWDDAGWYDPTSGRFTPQVAGRYVLTWEAHMSAQPTLNSYLAAVLRRNGVEHRRGSVVQGNAGGFVPGSAGFAIVVANGTTDFFDVVVQYSNAAALAFAGSFFQGALLGRT